MIHKYEKFCLILLPLIIIQAFKNVSSTCDHSDKSISFLDVATDMISKAKKHFPTCPTTYTKPMDCEELLSSGNHNKSGIYRIWPRSRLTGSRSLEVYCDMDTDGGGWTLLQRRGNFSRSNDYFFRDWISYKSGFGDIEKDFWLGNDNIFALTNQRLNSVRFDLKAVDGETRYAVYDTFWIDDESYNYSLHIKDYNGDAGDSMAVHDNQKFSTKDHDNDSHKEVNCAINFKGAWWYNACHRSNLNGLYLGGPHESHANGVNWYSFKGHKESLDTTEIKIRPNIFRKRHLLNETPRYR